jgi:predicted aspartyl protease
MSVRYNYNQQVSPPAPFIQLSVSRPDMDVGASASVPAQIDTAADFTVIPESLVEMLHLVQLDQIAVEGFGGHLSVVPTYLVKLSIHDFSPVFVRVLVGRNEPFVLLGRDVLNQFRLILDGPKAVFEIDQAS